MAHQYSNWTNVQEFQQLSDLAVRGFKNLIREGGCRAIDRDDDDGLARLTQQSLVIAPWDIANCKGDRLLLDRLQSSLIPLLRQQVIRISLSPDPADSLEQTSKKLKLIIAVQPGLDHTLGQIRYAVNTLRVNSSDSSNRTNDQHLQDLKCFRLEGLYMLFETKLLPDIRDLLNHASVIFRRLKQNKQFSAKRTELEVTHNRKTGCVDSALKTIDAMIRWPERSDLDLVQHDWPGTWTSDHIAHLYDLINSRTRSKKSKKYLSSTPLGQTVIQLAKSLIPVVKLSRIFINKLTKRGINTKRLPFYTEMCSDQMKSLSELPGDVNHELNTMMTDLRLATSVGGTARLSFQLLQTVLKLEKRLQSSVDLLLERVVPLIPDTDGFPTQNYLKNWFGTWSIQFAQAILNHRAAVVIFTSHIM
ncbi:hypothetical protein Pst134EB_002118 [Puccinia striiformis f. sp. tritici]|nr:hypothetical protein Pst134EB_002118 [Puccinia striiformis f. sp. tritici]